MSGIGRRSGRPRGVRASLAQIVLAVELVVVALGALVVFGLRDVPPALALGGGGVMLALIVVAAALATRPAGIALGWVIQVLLVLTVVVNVAVGVIGLLFGALWVYCMMVGGRIDRRDAASGGAD